MGFRIDSVVRKGDCILSSWVFTVEMDAGMKEVKMWLMRMGVRFVEKGRFWRLPGLLYAKDPVLCGK